MDFSTMPAAVTEITPVENSDEYQKARAALDEAAKTLARLANEQNPTREEAEEINRRST